MKLIRKEVGVKKKYRSVQIGARKFKIKYVTSIKEGEMELAGLYNCNEQTIYIKHPSETRERITEVLMHEITHGILFALGEFELGNDEKFVCKVAALMAQVLLTMEVK